MIGKNFPISDFYKEHILDAVTISRSGNWWSAILLIADPKNSKPFLSFYQWQKTNDGWKKRSSFKIRHRKDVDRILDAIKKFSESLE
jgi:hypothetical protein|tara:strand:- start:356 stop:616 length:261 start_codon:yes stop_codon:yes gene_type:complete